MSATREETVTMIAEILYALTEVERVCARPFGKDARQARQIARAALKKWEDFKRLKGEDDTDEGGAKQ